MIKRNHFGEAQHFSFGHELEDSQAKGMYTLYVSGLHSIKEIGQHLTNGVEPVKHIYFGVNGSFDHDKYDVDAWNSWESVILYFLDKGFVCSLDIPVELVDSFNETALNDYHLFIPKICITVPYVKLWNYNTIIKIDDCVDKDTNPGKWTYRLHSLLDHKNFVDHQLYENNGTDI